MTDLKSKERELSGLKLEIEKVKEKIEVLKEKKLSGLLMEKKILEDEIKSMKEKTK